MGRPRTCDNCGKLTNRVVFKLYLAPVNDGSNARAYHSNYTGHADIGECCAAILTTQIKWQKRTKQQKKANA